MDNSSKNSQTALSRRAVIPGEVLVDFWASSSVDVNQGMKSHIYLSDDVLVVRNLTILGSINVVNQKIYRSISIIDCYTDRIQLENSQLMVDIWVNNSDIGSISIQNTKVRNFRIDSTMCGDIIINKNSILGRLRVFNSSIMRLSLYDSSLSEVQLWNNEIERVWAQDNSFISYIRFLLHPQKPTHLIFEKCRIPYFDLKNTVLPEFNTMMLKNCEINLLDLEYFCNYGSVFLCDIQPLIDWEDYKNNIN